jgi:hypothetical protein
LAGIGLPAVAGPAFQLGESTSVDTSLTVGYTSSMRLNDASPAYLADLNNDDGTRNFKRHGLINNRLNVLGEVKVKHDNLGGLLRGSAFHDTVYQGANSNDSAGTVNKTGPANEFVDETRRLSGQNSRCWKPSCMATGSWARCPSTSSWAATRWCGESLFWPNISQGQVPVDATKFNVPGTEAKESYLPVGQLSASLGLTDSLTVTGYYQYKWEKSRLNPVGDYFGSDYFGPGSQFYRLAPGAIGSLPDRSFAVANYAGEISARDSGQWGLGARYQLSDNTELGLFHYRYHDRVGRCSTTSPAPPATRRCPASGRWLAGQHAVFQAGLLRGHQAHRRQRQHQVRRRGAGGRRPELPGRRAGVSGQRLAHPRQLPPGQRQLRIHPRPERPGPPDHAAGRGGAPAHHRCRHPHRERRRTERQLLALRMTARPAAPASPGSA